MRWPTPLYSTLDPSILALLPAASLPAASSAFWQWGDARAGGEAAGMARLDLIGVSSRSEEVLRREEARGSSTSEEASQEKTWGEAAQAERVRERLEAHLRAALQSLVSQLCMRPPPFFPESLFLVCPLSPRSHPHGDMRCDLRQTEIRAAIQVVDGVDCVRSRALTRAGRHRTPS